MVFTASLKNTMQLSVKYRLSSHQRDIDKYSFFKKTKYIIKFVTSVVVKMQSFDEIGQKLAKT